MAVQLVRKDSNSGFCSFQKIKIGWGRFNQIAPNAMLFGFLGGEFSRRHVATFDGAREFDFFASNFSFVNNLEGIALEFARH